MRKIHKIFPIVKIATFFVFLVSVFFSIVISQVFAPRYFSSLGQKNTARTAFLRASVKIGDSYLIKQVFHDSLVAEYPVVFDSYLQENDWLQRLQAIEKRSPHSRDVLAAMSILYSHAGKEIKARELREMISSIDPMYLIDESSQ